MFKENRYLKVEKLSKNEYYAFLTTDGSLVYKRSDIIIKLESDRVIISKVRGEFIKDFDLKLEVFELIKLLEGRK